MDSAALYLAKVMVADHRYRPLDFPEAAPLAEACDIVLVGGDGVSLAIACIVDRDANPEMRFTMSPAQVDEIAAACGKHAGSVYGSKEEVTVEIWEIGAGVPDTDDRARLEGYAFRRVTQKGVSVRGYAVDTSPNVGRLGALWSTAADATVREAWIRQALHQPRRSDNELAHAAEGHHKVARFDTRPLATYGLIASFAVMFVLELLWEVAPSSGLAPHVGTLISLGGLEHGRTEGGEWWRLLTCAFLHGDPKHLIFNSVAIYMAGGVLENLIGRRWMLGLFVIGAVGGSVASLTVNPDHITSVGASGAIMALLAAAMVASLRLPKGPARTQILISMAWILIPGLLPLATKGSGGVDYGAHLGGAIAGAIGGLALYVTWPRDAEHPRAGMFAAVIAAAGLAYTAFGWVQLANDHDEYEKAFAGAEVLARNPGLAKELVPDSEIPTDEAAIAERAGELVEKYPRDPRALYFAALVAIDDGRYEQGRTYLARALAEDDIRMLLTNPERFEVYLRWAYALAHEQDGDIDGARKAVAPRCAAGKAFEDAEMRAYYERLCAAP